MFFIQLVFVITSIFAADFSEFQSIPVQDAGRLKPLGTFATESLQLIYGRSSYKNTEGKKLSATEIVITWMVFPQLWQEAKVIEIPNRNIKEALKLPVDEKYFSFLKLAENDRLPTFFQELTIRVEGKEKLDVFFQGIQRISNQMQTFSAIMKGLIPGFIPPEEGSAWKTLSEMSKEEQEKFSVVASSFVDRVSGKNLGKEALLKDYLDWVYSKADKNLKEKISIEVHYNKVMPFEWVWIVLVVGLVFFSLFWVLKKPVFLKMSFAVNIIAFLLSTYAFILRVYLTGRPPVSNMYESVVWVAWGGLLFSIIIYLVKKNPLVIMSGAMMSALCFMVADFAPNILDPSLQPLVPVLRSNLWLTVHVLTITLSYAAFLLAFGLSDVALFSYLRKSIDKKKIKALSDAAYRSVQIGVVLLAAGTILGGVWADYSWGRFWGWDPKETWALIALLGYLALLHARLGGLLKDFGMFVGNIIAFNLVIMAWYGVNFVLGAGLHSYGFGGGGIEYMSAFVFIHFLYVGFVYFNRKQ